MDVIKKSRLLLCVPFFLFGTFISSVVGNPVPEEILGDFELIKDCKDDICKQWEQIDAVDVEGKFTVGKYRSKRTGLTVFLSRSETPIVNGYFCLATEAFDNDGLPHTLEHLIFRGSEDYPYKDTLDNLAAR